MYSAWSSTNYCGITEFYNTSGEQFLFERIYFSCYFPVNRTSEAWPETDGEIRKVNSEEEYPRVTYGSHKNESKRVTLEKTETENDELKRGEQK